MKTDPRHKSYKEWLEKEGSWFRNKLWQVVVELEAERLLRGTTAFKIPIERFKKKNIDLDDVRKLLINLEAKNLISVFKELGRTPHSNDPNKPMGSVGIGLKDDEHIFYDPKTELSLDHAFKYLHAALKKIQHPEKNLSTLDKKADKIINLFSIGNLPFVISVLAGISQAIEFAPNTRDVTYKLRSGSLTTELILERKLISKFKSEGLYKYTDEEGIGGIVNISYPNSDLIKKCIEWGKRRLARKEIDRRIANAEAQKLIEAAKEERIVHQNVTEQTNVMTAHMRDQIDKQIFTIEQNMNGIVMIVHEQDKYEVSRPELDSESDRFIQLLIAKSKDQKEIVFKSEEKDKLSTKPSILVTRLGFTGLLRKVFFPRTSKSSVIFRRVITEKDLIASSYTSESIVSELKQRLTVSA